MTTVAICQSNYIPWKGYFDLINRSDIFVLYDDVQFTRRDWRNRNRVKTQAGPIWLTIPVQVKGRYKQKISETICVDANWAKKHWTTLQHNYERAPFFGEYRNTLQRLYASAAQLRRLSDINRAFIEQVNDFLGIQTPIMDSAMLASGGGQTERLVNICKELGASQYLSGPAAKNYLDVAKFEREGIAVQWMSYDGYRPYPQGHGDFIQAVSVLDLLFNAGAEASKYMLSFTNTRGQRQ